MSLPGSLLPWVELRFLKLDASGVLVPNAGGFVEFRETDLTTPQSTFSNSGLTVANTNPIELDDDGRPPHPIFLLPNGYSVYVSDSDEVPLYDLPYVGDVGAIFLASFGQLQSQGSNGVSTSPYLVTDDDNTITVDAASLAVVQLPAAADRLNLPLTVKNVGIAAVRVTPDGTETIDDDIAGSGYVELPAATTIAPTITLVSDGVSNWLITGALGLG